MYASSTLFTNVKDQITFVFGLNNPFNLMEEIYVHFFLFSYQFLNNVKKFQTVDLNFKSLNFYNKLKFNNIYKYRQMFYLLQLEKLGSS